MNRLKNVCLVKYGEIILRGKNRGLFEKQLIKTIRKNLQDLGDFYVIREQGRFIVERTDDTELDFDTVIPKIKNIFGIIEVCPCFMHTDRSIENIREQVLALSVFQRSDAFSFRITSRRSDKKYPLTSNEIAAQIGEYVFENIPNATVDLHTPDVTIFVELRNAVYIYWQRVQGFGGLPQGFGSQAMLMLSGGIDSPVAGFLTAKRGVGVQGVYFHSPPYVSNRAKEKVLDLARKLSEYTGEFTLTIVPFTDVQLYLYENVAHEKLTLLLKRAMTKIACKLAKSNDCLAIITGDSIGQVASQTMQSLAAVDSASDMPVIRPLITMDKQEIINIAQKIDTFDISIRPFEDCCTIFVAKHPQTNPRADIIEKIEAKLSKLDELIDEAINKIEIIET